jgi:TraM recognition site of TraD and TraG
MWRILQLEDFLVAGVDPYWFESLGIILLVLAAIGVSPVVLETGLGSHGTMMVYLRRTVLCLLAALLTLGVGAAIILPGRLGAGIAAGMVWTWLAYWGPFLAAALIIGVSTRLLWQRYGAPWLSARLRWLRQEQETETLSDIRSEIEAYRALDYYPPDHYRPDAVFTGLSPVGQPVYLPLTDWYQTHKTVVGATRYGKGITAQIWADQLIRRGDGLIYVDPKGDDFLPLVLQQVCAETGRRFITVDLVDEQARGAWSPFVGGSPKDRRARFFDVMDLLDRGTDGDYYKAGARRRLVKLFQVAPSTTIGALLSHVEAAAAADEEARKAFDGVRSRLTEWAEYPKLAPKAGRGFSIEQSLLNNAIVYVHGDLDDNVIAGATRAFIMEVMQEARRLKKQRTAHLTVMVDEVRFTLSETLLRALATVLGAKVDIVTMYQNFGDLKAVADTRIDGEGALQSVRTNSQVKLLFGGTDAETAEAVAESSGTRLKKIAQMEQTEVNRSGGEVYAPVRRLKDEEETFVSMNTVLALPPRVAVLFRPRSLAEIVCVDKIPVKPAPAGAAPATHP